MCVLFVQDVLLHVAIDTFTFPSGWMVPSSWMTPPSVETIALVQCTTPY